MYECLGHQSTGKLECVAQWMAWSNRENHLWSERIPFHKQQECIPVGCVPPASCSSPSMHCSWGVYLLGGVPAGRCTCLGEVYLPRGVYLLEGWVYLPRGFYLPGGYLPIGGECICRGGTFFGGVPDCGGYLPGGYLPRYSPPCKQNS